MLTASAARTYADLMRSAILSARCAVVYFTKADGSTRRMVCHVPDAGDTRAFARKANHLLVWDVEKGGVRTVNLDTVTEMKPVATRQPAAAAPQPAPAAQPARRPADLAYLFDNGAPRKGQRYGARPLA